MNSHSLPVAVLSTALLVAGCNASTPDSEPAETPRSSAATPDPSPDTSVQAAELIRFGEDGVVIGERADVAKLEGAPEAFKKFIGDEIEGKASVGDSACDQAATITVSAIETKGYARGRFFECGGYAIIWATVAGQWREVWGGQDIPVCLDMNQLGVPESIADETCFDGEDEVPYEW